MLHKYYQTRATIVIAALAVYGCVAALYGLLMLGTALVDIVIPSPIVTEQVLTD